MQLVFGGAAAALLVPVAVSLATQGVLRTVTPGSGMGPAGWAQYLAFNCFELCVGVFWPSLMKARRGRARSGRAPAPASAPPRR